MKKQILAAVSFAVGCAFASEPGIVAGSVGIEVGEVFSTVTYTLTGMPAVVTIDLQTNTMSDCSGEWVSIGGGDIGFLGGEANKVVYATNTPVTAYWYHSKACPKKTFPAGSLRAEVTAWPTNTPPDYMVVNLCDGWNVVRWYPSTDALPGGFSNPEYKSTKMVMRKIPAKNVTWMMGSPGKLTDEDNQTVNSPAHKVKLTEDYYIGIYEVTQSQFTNMGGKDVSKFTNLVDSAYHPAERIGYPELRGTNYRWNRNGLRHEVAPTSPINTLRCRCGIADMDLPTEAQWEYACRAGSATECQGNLEFTEANVGIYAVISSNSGHKTAAVGSKRANDWGIYDMLGNVYELCLDASGVNGSSANNLGAFHDSLAEGWESGAVTADPVGAVSDSGNPRITKRGGYFNGGFAEASCRHRTDGSLTYDVGLTGEVGYIGFRLCCSAKEAVK